MQINNVQLGTALAASATKVMLLGSGELGKEVAIECQRLGLEVMAVDRYANAPAMQVAHYSRVIDMLDGTALEQLITDYKPDYVIAEIEAIATAKLVELEAKGLNVVPSAQAVNLTMNREGIRRLAAEELKLNTSPFQFCDTQAQFKQALTEIGLPCVIKPIMSSSGKGQSLIKSADQQQAAWQYAQQGGRAGQGRVIVEGFVDFDYEITLLTVHAVDGIHFCAPIGHRQQDGDYQESWQPAAMSAQALANAQQMASKIVTALGGYGLFGVELFVKGDEVIFSEVSPRPHDTGLVTLISQNLSEFALHVRAFLGLPIGEIMQYGASASAVILPEGDSDDISFSGIERALALPNSQLRLFAKPSIQGRRRLGVALSQSQDIASAIEKAKQCANLVNVQLTANLK